ncbi:hypothetical protein AB0J72_22035 [Dactylosporangium sp. NPDC049742]
MELSSRSRYGRQPCPIGLSDIFIRLIDDTGAAFKANALPATVEH